MRTTFRSVLLGGTAQHRRHARGNLACVRQRKKHPQGQHPHAGGNDRSSYPVGKTSRPSASTKNPSSATVTGRRCLVGVGRRTPPDATRLHSISAFDSASASPVSWTVEDRFAAPSSSADGVVRWPNAAIDLAMVSTPAGVASYDAYLCACVRRDGQDSKYMVWFATRRVLVPHSRTRD